MPPINTQRPALVDIQKFPKGHERRLAGVNNRVIGEVFENTTSDAPKIMAAIRWSMLRLFRSRFAHEVGIGKATVAELERDRPEGSRPQRDVYTKVIQYLTPERIGHDVREQLLQAFVPGDTTLDLEERIGFEIGFTKMLEIIDIGDKAWYQRRKMGVIADPGELIHLVDKAYAGKKKGQPELHDLRMEQAMRTWTNETVGRYRSRTLEEPLAQLLTDLQLYCVRDHRSTFSVRTICDLSGCTEDTAADLLNARLVPWERVEPVVDEVYGAGGDIHSAWMEAEETERHRERFSTAFTNIRDANGIRNTELTACLGVVAPEKRIDDYEVHRTEGYRPSSEVRRAIELGSFFGQVQMRALVGLVSGNAAEGMDLERIFRMERERHYRRTGSALEGRRLQLRIDREWNGVDLEALARGNVRSDAHDDEVSVEAKRLNSIEIAHGSGGEASDHLVRPLQSTVDRLGQQRLEEVLLRQRERRGEVASAACSEATTVQGFVSALREWLGSLRTMQQRISDATGDRSLKLSSQRMTRVLAGDSVPTLPILQNMSNALLESDLPEIVKQDWYDKFAERGSFRGDHIVESPVERALATVVASCAASPVAFAEERMSSSPKLFWTTLRPNDRCPEIRWENVEAILLAADIGPTKPTWWLLRKVVKEGMAFRPALQSTVAQMGNKNMRVTPHALIGVSWEQLKTVGLKKPKEQPAK